MDQSELLKWRKTEYAQLFIFPITNHFQLDRPADSVKDRELVAVDTLSPEIHSGYVDYSVGTIGRLEHNRN